jgi:hypothetical protein
VSTLVGALQVAAQQHATLLGWAFVSVFVASNVATEFGNGAWELSVAASGRARLLMLKKAMALPLLVLTSELIVTAALRVAAASVPSWFGGRDAPGLGLAALSLVRSVLITEWVGVAACLIALLSGSPLLTAALPPALLTLPNRWTWSTVSWFTPGRWMTEFMRPSVFGEGADYFGNAAGSSNHVVLALLLLTVTGFGLAVLATWRVERPLERRVAA